MIVLLDSPKSGLYSGSLLYSVGTVEVFYRLLIFTSSADSLFIYVICFPYFVSAGGHNGEKKVTLRW